MLKSPAFHREMPMTRRILAAFLVLLWAASGALAHHSNAMFDMQQTIVVDGRVTKFEWSAPHVYITVQDAKGSKWRIEGPSPGILSRMGWSRNSFRSGDAVTVRGRPSRDAAKTEAFLRSITGPDGKQLNGQEGYTTLPTDQVASSLSGTWQGDAAVTGKMLARLTAHPLTKAGDAARAAFRPEMNPVAKCVSWPTPFIVAATNFYPMTIKLNDKTILFQYEFLNTTRLVHMDRRIHPASGKSTVQGDSVGWWEDKTLVVDTRLFLPHLAPFGGPAAGIPGGKDKHVVERYTLDKDGRQIAVDVWMEDPEYLREPFSANLVLRYSPGLKLDTANCDPKSAARYLQ
jgi:hypothetical protein